jgi:hypothetical protein
MKQGAGFYGIVCSRAAGQGISTPHAIWLTPARLGELVQIDDSNHHWFVDRAPASALRVYFDDATCRLMALCFVHSASAYSHFEATAWQNDGVLLQQGQLFPQQPKEALGGDGRN